MAIFRHFAKAIYSKAKLSKMADFGDETGIDKIRNTAEMFPFMSLFFMNSRNRFGLIL